MKNFFAKLFENTTKQGLKSIVDFEVLDSIYSHLYYVENNVKFKMKGIHDKVSINLYSFPGTFYHDEQKEEIKKNGFKNPYEVLNQLYKKVDISLVSEQDIEKEFVCDFIHVQFFSEPTPEMRKHLKHALQNFMIFFCCINNSSKVNSFRILYSNGFFLDYTKDLLDAKYIDINSPENEIQKIGFKDFEIVLKGICQHLKIELPKNINLASSNDLMPEEVIIEHFEEFIVLISRGNIEDKLLKKQAKRLFKNFNKPNSERHSIVEGHIDFFESIDCWNSDWKFDPEDAEYFISEMIEQDLNFEYPEDTYSHDLFPYIQSALVKFDYELMTYDTQGDNYLFFVANNKDVDRIAELSELIEIPIDFLN